MTNQQILTHEIRVPVSLISPELAETTVTYAITKVTEEIKEALRQMGMTPTTPITVEVIVTGEVTASPTG